MKTELYLSVKNAILTTPDVTDVRIWSSALFNEPDILGILPVVFIEVQNINYNQATSQFQEVERPLFRLHLLYKAIDSNDTSIFDISQNIYKALSKEGFIRISENASFGTGEIIDWQIEIEAPRFVDDDARKDFYIEPKKPLQITL